MMLLARITVLIAFSHATQLMAGEEMISRDVCHLETFEASCSESHVLLVHEALYGTMEINRCITTAFGHEGCHADVLPLLDKECSGRRTCSFPVTLLHGRQYSGPRICPAELTSYLFVRYSCKEVMSCDTVQCQSTGQLDTEIPERAVLSSEMTLTSGCGSTSCPWVLEAQPGQLFNVTLLDLWPKNDPLTGVSETQGPYCHRYASITEEGYTPKEITSCGRDYQRFSHIYESHTNRITITMYEPRTKDINMHFLISYEVSQCPDMDAPPHAVATRHGDQLAIKCTTSVRSWTLVCQGVAWVGEIGICDSAQTGVDGKGSKGSPFGMLIVVGLGVALGVLIGMILLVMVFIFMRRHRRRELINRQNTLLSDFSPSRDAMNNKLRDRGATLPTGGTVRYAPDHSFAATIQLKRPHTCIGDERYDFPLLTTTTASTPDCLEDIMTGNECKMAGCPVANCHIYETSRVHGGPPNTTQIWQPCLTAVDKSTFDSFGKDSSKTGPETRIN